jgi:porin
LATSTIVLGQEGKNIHSVLFTGTYTSLPWYNVSGGIKSGFAYNDNVDLSTTIQFGNILDWDNNAIIYIYGIGNNGGSVSSLTGDYQGASNIEALQSFKLFEVWGQKNFKEGRFSLLFGMYNLNSEFDIINPATFFINSSFGMGAEYAQSGENGPSSFPYSSVGVRATARIDENKIVKVAVLDGVSGDPQRPLRNTQKYTTSDGLLIATELTIFTDKNHERNAQNIDRKDISRWIKVGRNKEENDYNRLNIGGWYYTSQFVELLDSTVASKGNGGMYIGYQQYFSINPEKGRYISLFGRAGFANPSYNRLGTALSGGIVFHELIRNDQIGLAFTSAINGDSYRSIMPMDEKAETAIELTYTSFLTSFLTVQPDIQYIINPNTDKSLSNALSFALLAQISFGI